MSVPPAPPKSRRRRRPQLLVWVVALMLGLLVWQTVALVRRYPYEPGKQVRAYVEIRQLGNAVGTFKAKMNVNHLPAGFRLKAAYDPADPEAAYLRQLFPQIDLADTGLPPETDHVLDPNQALMFFLTGAPATKHEGFSTDQRRPFRGPVGWAEGRIGPFLDTDNVRPDAAGRLLDPWGTPYAYLAFDPTTDGYPDRDCLGVRPYRLNGQPLNKKSYQIISAGPDRRFGPGDNWNPGMGPWAADGPGADDLSNFNSGRPLGWRNPLDW